MSEVKSTVDLKDKVKFITQFSAAVGDVDRDGDHDAKDEAIACCAASKLMIASMGFGTVNADKRIDAVVFSAKTDGKLIKSKSFEQAVELMHKNLDEGKPVLVGVNRGKRVGNANPATSHFVVIVGRRYNEQTSKYEYPFFDPGTRYLSKGTSKNQFFTLNDASGTWKANPYYNPNMTYIITEVRPTLDKK